MDAKAKLGAKKMRQKILKRRPHLTESNISTDRVCADYAFSHCDSVPISIHEKNHAALPLPVCRRAQKLFPNRRARGWLGSNCISFSVRTGQRQKRGLSH